MLNGVSAPPNTRQEPTAREASVQELAPLAQNSSLTAVCSHIAAALQLTPEERTARFTDIINIRLAGIDSTPQQDFLAGYTQLHVGPIHPQATIEARVGLPGFQLNDSLPYQMLLENFAANIDTATATASTVRQTALTQVLWTIGTYFGNFEGNAARDAARQAKYMDADSEGTFSIADFHRSGIAMCVEKAALAQNLLAFLGHDVELFGTRMGQDGKDTAGHAFNVLHTDKGHFLVDFANPIRVNLPDGSCSYMPNVHVLTDEQYKDLLTGKGVTVQVSDLTFDGHSTAPCETVRATYMSPNLSSTTAHERVQAALAARLAPHA